MIPCWPLDCVLFVGELLLGTTVGLLGIVIGWPLGGWLRRTGQRERRHGPADRRTGPWERTP